VKAKIKSSFRFSEEAVILLNALAATWGLSNTGTLEKIIRDVARKEATPANIEWARKMRTPLPTDSGEE
jgi:hypothetical protein